LRASNRRTLIFYLPVKDLSSGRVIGHLADITRRGCLILSKEPLYSGDQRILQVELPQKPYFQSTRLRFKAAVRWVKREKDREIYHTGLLLIKKEKRTDQVIDLLIEKIGFSDGEKKIRLADNQGG